MRVLCTTLLFSAAILNAIELSSQSKRLPDGSPDQGSHRCRPPSSLSPSGNGLETTHPLTTSDDDASSSSPRRERSRSPTLKDTFPSVFGFSFEDLASIRLIPHNNPNRNFELRKYVFPPDKRIGLKARSRELNLMPPKEQIVLSTSDGDICAILDKSSTRNTDVRAIFTFVFERAERVKINMNSGAVDRLTPEEITDCPATTHGRIVKSYGVLQFKNTDHSLVNPLHSVTSSTPAEPRLRDPGNSSTLRKLFPRVLGYSFRELLFIRLAPLTHTNRILELRTYVFPPDKPIRFRTRTHILIPMPTEEQIVLSTPNGDICAILEKASNRQTFIRAMFTPIFGMEERAKINMHSGVVEEMNAEELAGCPLSARAPIKETYKIFRV